ncbi:NfeD family protein [Pyrobaculum calidifontis]|uniref:NfeD-like C-terminal domain-containing protein n=1 Tax=Pyrobaculum calidifontis (strain DSM 21063 / JCM 11548 / VA1) TaxID=410359 RepID=A3MS69_PYRCJ|nr:NfeD family protein [Pyrobaculum calidifontis]ABO07486.1 protein of unknown function DUF107 [Pyrobaculum calidifontis JCM 11548]
MRLLLLLALLDDLLLLAAPAVVALALYALGVIPLWAAAAVAAPFAALAAYVGAKVVKERPRGFAYVGGRGVAVEDLGPRGVVKIGGEYWRAVCVGGCTVSAGSCVELVEVRDGVAYVTPC